MGKNRSRAFVTIVVGIIAFLICVSFLPEEQRNLVNYFTVLGTISSVFGLILVYFQILSLKATTEETKKAVDNAIQKTNQFISIADLSKSVRVIVEIQEFIKRKKYEFAQLRMRDLRDSLVQLESIVSAELPQAIEEYQEFLVQFTIDLENLNLFLLRKGATDFTDIINNLEKMSTLLNSYEGRLKFKNYGS